MLWSYIIIFQPDIIDHSLCKSWTSSSQNTIIKYVAHSLPAIFVHFDWWSSSSSEKSSGLPLLLNFALADELGENSYRPALGGGGLQKANILLKWHDTMQEMHTFLNIVKFKRYSLLHIPWTLFLTLPP